MTWWPSLWRPASYGVKGMALLDKANTQAYGNPQITKVNIGAGKNPGILISGHDLRDLEMLLEQTQGTGVDVYTHSEMLPAHYYPAFQEIPPFRGQLRQRLVQAEGGIRILPRPHPHDHQLHRAAQGQLQGRLFTTGAAGFPGCPHIPGGIGEKKDFSPIIQMAKTCPPPTPLEEGEIVGGFAHEQVFALADKVVEAVKSGAVKKFVVMAGCDGRHQEPGILHPVCPGAAQGHHHPHRRLRQVPYNKLPWVISAAFPGCWTPDSATTPTLWRSSPSS